MTIIRYFQYSNNIIHLMWSKCYLSWLKPSGFLTQYLQTDTYTHTYLTAENATFHIFIQSNKVHRRKWNIIISFKGFRAHIAGDRSLLFRSISIQISGDFVWRSIFPRNQRLITWQEFLASSIRGHKEQENHTLRSLSSSFTAEDACSHTQDEISEFGTFTGC